MLDADIISCVRRLRRLVVTLDSIGFPIRELLTDEDIGKLVNKKLPDKVLSTSSDVHFLIQNIEKSKRYKDAIQNLCGIKVREEPE